MFFSEMVETLILCCGYNNRLKLPGRVDIEAFPAEKIAQSEILGQGRSRHGLGTEGGLRGYGEVTMGIDTHI